VAFVVGPVVGSADGSVVGVGLLLDGTFVGAVVPMITIGIIVVSAVVGITDVITGGRAVAPLVVVVGSVVGCAVVGPGLVVVELFVGASVL
jgi:hypothetical protein